MYDGLIAECKTNFKKEYGIVYNDKNVAQYRARYGPDFEECNTNFMRNMVSNGEKTMQFSETIQFTLIPPSSI